MSSATPLQNMAALNSRLHAAARHYPEVLIPDQIKDIPRISFNIGLVAKRRGFDVSVCDLGGGIGLFSVGCAASGMRATLVDDFNDPVNHRFRDVPKTVHKAFAVTVIGADIIASPPELPLNSFDVITSFDSIEHWHHSPKALLHRALTWLRPGGLLVIGAPNCVNLRKRITVPLGMGKWTAMPEWYEETAFRGHVREPDVDDLRYIARDLALENVEIIGRNWLGYYYRSALMRLATKIIDVPLRAFPSLCADIYVLGTKPLQ